MVGEFGVDFDVVCCTLMWVSSGVSRINPSAIYRIPIPLAILDPSQQSADLTRSHKPEMACLPLALVCDGLAFQWIALDELSLAPAFVRCYACHNDITMGNHSILVFSASRIIVGWLY
jgi:hypothetical protein